MEELKISCKLLVCMGSLLLYNLHASQSVEIKCIPIKSCPLILQMLSTKKQTPETMEFLKFSHCGYDDQREPMVWCSMLNFCKTPDERNGTCTPVKKCKPFLELASTLNTLDHEHRYYLNQFRCNNILEDIHVCCPTQPLSKNFKTPIEPNFDKIPAMSSRFDYDYEDNDYRMLGDEPENNNHNTGFHGNMHSIDTGHRWHHHHDENYDRYHHDHSYGHHNYHQSYRTEDVPGDDTSNDNDERNVNGNSHHVTTEHEQNHDRTTERNNWLTKKTTTPKSRSTTPKEKERPSDEDAIIFVDSMEDITTEKSSRRSTTARSQSNNSGQQKTCQTPDKKTGSCVKESNCERYLKLKSTLDKSKETVRSYLAKFKCNSTSAREIYICCENDEEVIDNSVISHERGNENIPEPYSKICGRQRENTNRVFGGSSADLGEFPWMALLRYPSSKGMQFGCGGTLISNRHVLTAAHCVDEEILKSKKLGQVSQIVLGEYDTRNKTDCFYMEFGEDCADPPITVGVDSIMTHSLYNSETTRNDIALIKLNQDVKFTDFIKPICLPTKTSTLNGNETFVIAGWGRTPTEPFSPVLKKAKIPYVKKQDCNSRSPSNRQLIEGQICAGLGNGTDSCNGDSGGPLMLNINFKNFEIVAHVVGIISYGFGRCVSGPSVNTYVPYYVDWIQENMK